MFALELNFMKKHFIAILFAVLFCASFFASCANLNCSDEAYEGNVIITRPERDKDYIGKKI